MTWWKPTPRSMAIIYFGCFAAAWGGIAVLASAAEDGAIPVNAFHATPAADFLIVGIIALAAHAFAVALLAWKAHRWLFSHGPIAVVLCGLPLIALVRALWFVPAFLYLIAVLHVWLASRHESIGRLQAPRRHSAETGSY